MPAVATMKPRIQVRRVQPRDERGLAKLLAKYFRSIRARVGWQDAHLATASYMRPSAGAWLALVDGMPVGCVAVRPLGRLSCEMKHLFVLPGYRGMRIAQRLVRAVHRHARTTRRKAVYLDTLASMTAAQALYAQEGYAMCAPYHGDTVDRIFMKKRLDSRRCPMARSRSATRACIAWAALLVAAFVALPTLADTMPFALFDNMYYKGKPDTTADGFVVSNILYEGVIWPHNVNYGVLPDRGAYEKLVRSHSTNPGPLVIDIEELPLKGSPDVARQHLQTLATLADWAHAAAPGKIVGYYGTNTLTRVAPADLQYAMELAKHVDAFFPPAYTFDDDRTKWQQRAQDEATEAHALDPAKPVYFYMWPQYHDNTPKQFQFVDAAYWTFQLDSASHLSNGIVLWSPGKFDWNDSTGWWSATQKFARSLRWRKP